MKKKELNTLISKALLGTYTLTLTPSYMVHAEQIESIDTSISIETDVPNTDYTEEPQDSLNIIEPKNDDNLLSQDVIVKAETTNETSKENSLISNDSSAKIDSSLSSYIDGDTKVFLNSIDSDKKISESWNHLDTKTLHIEADFSRLNNGSKYIKLILPRGMKLHTNPTSTVDNKIITGVDISKFNKDTIKTNTSSYTPRDGEVIFFVSDNANFAILDLIVSVDYTFWDTINNSPAHNENDLAIQVEVGDGTTSERQKIDEIRIVGKNWTGKHAPSIHTGLNDTDITIKYTMTPDYIHQPYTRIYKKITTTVDIPSYKTIENGVETVKHATINNVTIPNGTYHIANNKIYLEWSNVLADGFSYDISLSFNSNDFPGDNTTTYTLGEVIAENYYTGKESVVLSSNSRKFTVTSKYKEDISNTVRNASIYNDINTGNTTNHYYLGGFNITNLGGETRKKGVRLEFPSGESSSIGVTRVKIPTLASAGTYYIDCTLWDKKTDNEFSGTIKVSKSKENYDYSGYSLSLDTIKSQLSKTHNLESTELYIKSINYTIGKLPIGYSSTTSSSVLSPSKSGHIYGVILNKNNVTSKNNTIYTLNTFDDNDSLLSEETQSITTTITNNGETTGGVTSFDFLNSKGATVDNILAGENIHLKGTMRGANYPYFTTLYLSKPIVYLKLPKGITLDTTSTKFIWNKGTSSESLEWVVSNKYSPKELSDGTYLYEIEFKNDNFGIGYYSNKASFIGELNYNIVLKTTKSTKTTILNVKDILYLSDKNINVSPTSGAWASYFVQDTLDINQNGSTTDKISTHSSNKYLTITSNANWLETNFEIQVNNENYTLNPIELKSPTDVVNLKFNINNINGGITKKDDFYYFIPIPKQGISYPTNIKSTSETFDFSMNLQKFIDIPNGFDILYSTDNINFVSKSQIADINSVSMIKIIATKDITTANPVDFIIPLKPSSDTFFEEGNDIVFGAYGYQKYNKNGNITSFTHVFDKLTISTKPYVEDNWLNREVARQVFADENRYIDLLKNDYTKISSIKINGGLSGIIPKEIGLLSNIKTLNLCGNSLNGEIPKEIYSLTQLEFLDLSENQFTGTISSNISNLSKLKVLNLGRNQLTGTIPDNLYKLTELTDCLLYHNRLSGSISKNIKNLKNINQFHLGDNNLSGEIPAEISALKKMTYLHIWGNNFSGEIPEEMGQLTELRDIALNYNSLEGNIPDSFGNLTNLVALRLYSNNLSGDLPSSIGELPNLATFDIRNNQFISVPDSIKNRFASSGSLNSNLIEGLSNQKQLVLKNNETINAKLGDKLSLTNLNSKVEVEWNGDREPLNSAYKIEYTLDENFIDSKLYTIDTGVTSIPLSIIGSSKTNPFTTTNIGIEVNILSTEAIEDNWLNREVARQVGKDFRALIQRDYDKITDINLSKSGISGEIPKDIGRLVNLKSLIIYDNELHGEIPNEFYQLKNLENINIGLNELEGTISSKIGSFSRLQTLNIGNNNFRGSIPKEIGKLSELTYLRIAMTDISGTIPKEIGNLSNLNILMLHGNNLSGAIPKEIGNLTNLTDLRLYSNNLTGSIPKEIGNLTELKLLSLYDNKLSGEIPDEIFKLKDIEYLELNQNNLVGNISERFNEFSNLNHLLLKENQFINIDDDFPANFRTEDCLKGNLLEGIPNQKQLVLKNNETISTKLGYKITLSKLESKVEVEWNGIKEPLNSAYKIEYKLDENFIDSKLYTIDTGVTSIPLNIIGSEETNTFATTSTSIDVTIANNKTIADNWLNREVARQVGKDFKDLTDKDYASITDIDVSNQNIDGEIPKDIQNLINLKSLNISDNNIKGSIPNELWSLENLEILNATSNNLSGVLSSNIKNALSLQRLNLYNNNISGTIPKEICSLPNLSYVSLSTNNLSGEIPKNIGTLTKLTKLDLNTNNLSGEIPESIGNLVNLNSLHLIENNLSGNIPSSIGNMQKVTQIYLDSNNLSGEIPSTIKNLNNLLVLTISNNQIIGLPDGYPTNLKRESSLNGNLIENMPNQKQLVLKNNETINTKLGNKITLSKLESKVEIEWNGVREPLNSAYKVESNIDENFIDSKLYTIDTGVTSIPLSIVGSDETNTFTTTATPIEVTIENNKVIEDNWLNREVARQVGKDFKDLTDSDYKKITRIQISGKNIQDVIPKDIGKLVNLIELDLQCNNIIGEIPKEIGNLKNITLINLWNNNLNGTIPKEISKLSKLEFLSFYENNLTGEILSYLKNLTSLHTLDLGKNNFTGEVGNNLINLSKLRYLTLNYNNFTGILQSYFNNFTNLTTASFINNQFIGIEDGFPEKFKTNGSLEGNLIEGVPNQKQLVITNPISIQVEQGKKLTVPTTTLKNVYLEWNGVTEPLSSYYKTDYVFTDDSKFDSKLYAVEHGTTELKSRIAGTSYTSSNSIDVEVIKKYVPLSITATVNTKDWTKDDVIITMNTTGSEDIEYIEMIGGQQVQNAKTAEFVITQNGTYEFIAKSVIGEEKSITVKVTNIDKEKPIATVTQKENILKATVTLTLNITESGSGIKEIILPNGKITTTKTVTYEAAWDGDYTFTIIDKAGNVTVVTETVGGIQYDELWLAREVARQVKKDNIQDLTLEDFESITTINLANKRIVGQIPDYIGVMTNLTTLKLNGNDLRNKVPDSIGDLDNLKTLNLSDNRLTGVIPSTIGDMESLENLDLGLNFFTGEIPSSLGNLQYIKTIYLCENRLTGEIPESLGELETLRNLCLDYNQLIGQVPKPIQELAATKDFRYNFLDGETKQNTISIKSKASITLNLNEEITHSAIKNSVNIVTSINKTDVLDNPYSYTLEFEDDSFIENGVSVKAGTTKAKVKINYKDIDNSTVTSTTSIDVIIK